MAVTRATTVESARRVPEGTFPPRWGRPFEGAKTLVLENSRRKALDEKNNGGLGYDSTERITLARTTARHVTTPAKLHACDAPRGLSRTQPGVVEEDNHALERARCPRCASQNSEGDAHGAGSNEI